MGVTRKKECYCHACKKWFHYLGIARHRAMHRERHDEYKITYTHGNSSYWNYKYNCECSVVETTPDTEAEDERD